MDVCSPVTIKIALGVISLLIPHSMPVNLRISPRKTRPYIGFKMSALRLCFLIVFLASVVHLFVMIFFGSVVQCRCGFIKRLCFCGGWKSDDKLHVRFNDYRSILGNRLNASQIITGQFHYSSPSLMFRMP